MSKLSKPRHESVAQALFKGTSADKAYAEAGFKPSRFNAARFAKKEHILQRVTELQAAAAEKAEVTVELIAAQLDEDRALAHKKGQAGAAVAASMGKAKLYGLGVDKSNSIPNINHNYASMTEEEVLFEIAAIHQNLRQIKASKGRSNSEIRNSALKYETAAAIQNQKAIRN